jgi:hypothetical protein
MSGGEPLISDGVTEGIVRIGDTVRRPLRPFSLTVQAYLAHLRDVGFTGAPLPLGVDEQGREMLSFVSGDVPRWPLPPEMTSDEVLVALARLVRALHEASAGWVPPPGAVWGGTPANPGRVAGSAQLVSHRDYALGNVVFRGGLPAALIDFDLAMPTTRLYDIVNALWFWAPLRDPRDRSPVLADADIPHRVAVFADAYGMTAQQRAGLAPLAVDVVRRYHQDSRRSADLDPVWRKLWEGGGSAGIPAKVYLPRAEAWVREMAPAITDRLVAKSGLSAFFGSCRAVAWFFASSGTGRHVFSHGSLDENIFVRRNAGERWGAAIVRGLSRRAWAAKPGPPIFAYGQSSVPDLI